MNSPLDWQQAQDFVAFIADQIGRIPAAAWVGIVGAAIVAWWANRGQTERLRLQLEAERERLTEKLDHDSSKLGIELAEAATERALERTQSMRREVYFAVASQLARTQARFAQAATMDSIPAGWSDDLHLELGRIELVGDGRSRELAQAVSRAYRAAALAVIDAHRPVAQARLELEGSERACRNVAEDLQELGERLSGIRNQQAGGIVNPAGLEELPALTQQQADLRERQEALHAAQSKALATVGSAHDEAQRQITAALEACTLQAKKLSAAMRRELGFDDPRQGADGDGASEAFVQL